MTTYTLSNKAKEDAEGIYDYTNEKFGSAQAETYLIAIHECLSMLAVSPKLAITAKEIREDYFRYPIHKHMIFFKQEENGIYIVRVLHQQMQYSLHLV